MFRRAESGFPFPNVSQGVASRLQSLNPTIGSSDPYVEIRSQLKFYASTKTFICSMCRDRCYEKANIQSGLLNQVKCNNCRLTWEASDMPYEWVNPALWGKTKAYSGINYATPERPMEIPPPLDPMVEVFARVPPPKSLKTYESSAGSNALSHSLPLIKVNNASPGVGSKNEGLPMMSNSSAHPFASNSDRARFTILLGEYASTGTINDQVVLEEVLSSLPEQSKAFHVQRLERVRRNGSA
jgi:hypothetical protein